MKCVNAMRIIVSVFLFNEKPGPRHECESVWKRGFFAILRPGSVAVRARRIMDREVPWVVIGGRFDWRI